MQRYDNYGVPRDVFAKFKMAGFYAVDFAVLMGAGFFAWYFNMRFPISQFLNMIIFDVVTAIEAIFLVVHTNGKKRNYMVIILYLRMLTSRIKRQYKPIKNNDKVVKTNADF